MPDTVLSVLVYTKSQSAHIDQSAEYNCHACDIDKWQTWLGDQNSYLITPNIQWFQDKGDIWPTIF